MEMTDTIANSMTLTFGPTFVKKKEGYPWFGLIVGGFTANGKQRWNVENLLAPGCIHIFSTEQLEVIEDPSQFYKQMVAHASECCNTFLEKELGGMLQS